jgi:hypothetical protein
MAEPGYDKDAKRTAFVNARSLSSSEADRHTVLAGACHVTVGPERYEPECLRFLRLVTSIRQRTLRAGRRRTAGRVCGAGS